MNFLERTSRIFKQSLVVKRAIPHTILIHNCQIRVFSTTQKKTIHPVVLTLIKPISRILPMIIGRSIRKKWKNLTPEHQAVITLSASENHFEFEHPYILSYSLFLKCLLIN